ncbi:MAG: ABC transporter ATP-binding protein [Betaproteobacteria bacterium]|nr:ABC transporter ATP-binding protein [Betaproteobacteria bacterium]
MGNSTKGDIELARVTKRFGETVAVREIDLKIPGGAYCCLLGPSGCGKTTILRMIAGHEDPTQGDVLIDGERVNGEPPVRRGTAMMFQSYALFPHLTCAENVAFNLKVRGIPRTERLAKARDMLAQVRMEQFADRVPAQLSGGQQQRIALARALITNPRVLLLDEPLSALDEFLRLRMRGELKRMQKEFGITFIHVTHTQMEAIALADMVVVMDQGRIEQAGPAREVYERPRTSYVARFMGGQNVLAGKVLEHLGDHVLVQCGPRKVRVSVAGAMKAGDLFNASIRRDRITVRRAPGENTEAGLNSIVGRVGTIEYQGSWVKLPVEGAMGEEFVANLLDNDYFAEPVQSGDWVTAAWKAEEMHYVT